MIISHKYKFIFIRPSKVGGTSIEIALARNHGDKDIITPISEFNPDNDEDKYNHPAKNYKDKEFFNHITPDEVKNKIGNKIWDKYYKFTVVRNPWDQTASRYWWKRYSKWGKFWWEGKNTIKKVTSNLFNPKAYKFVIGKIRRPKSIVNNLRKKWTNKNWTDKLYYIYKRGDPGFDYFIRTRSKKWANKYWENTLYYFDEKGKPVCDFYIRYENLQKDYEKVCRRLGMPCEKLPKTKNKTRKEKKHYSLYYNSETREIIHNLFKKEIDYFGYKFERK